MAALSRIGGRALATLLPDLGVAPGPLYAALAHAIRALVLDGRVAPNTRLPSERELAVELQVSRATVTAAYDTLRVDGFLTSRTGSGSYIRVPASARVRRTLSGWHLASDSDGSADELIDLSRATLPAAPIVAQTLASAGVRAAGHLAHDGYEPAGIPEFRQAVAERFTVRGAPTRPDQVLATNGALHALDLVLRLLLSPGDRVVTELPTYPGALDAVRANNGRVVPVPMAREGGWQVDQLCATLRQAAPRVAVLIPDFHNPTGSLMSPEDRRQVLRAARTSGTTVVVDETFVDLGLDAGPGSPPTTAALDPSVITIGSMSKTVWGGLRTGWLRGPAELVRRLAALRTSLDLGGPVLEQVLAASLVERIDEVAAERVAELRPRRDALLTALAEQLPQWTPSRPRGGMSLWVELDAPLSTPLSVLAGQVGVVIVPGSRFGVDGTLERFVRLPFAQPEDRLRDAVSRLARVWAQLEPVAVPPGDLVVA